jgi:hypothetical protein
MNATVQFTRYLYIKDEVKYSILISLLKKNDEARFWAYEFYYSGFKEELWNFLWQIYYDFYASLNPKFKKFLTEKHAAWKETPTNDLAIAQIIDNLKIRPWNMDVFLLKHKAKTHAQEVKGLSVLLADDDIEGLTHYILANPLKENDIIIFNTHFQKNFFSKKMSKDEILSNIVHLYSIKASIKMGKSLFIISDDDLSPYRNIYAHYDSSFYPYKILPIATKYGIDSESMLSLFHLSRDATIDIQRVFHYHWLYYTYNTPIWSNRLEEFEGTPNHETKDIDFEDDDDFDEFYDHFGYGPDEQKLDQQNKNIGPIKNISTWKSVFEKANKGIYKPLDDLWRTMNKISY